MHLLIAPFVAVGLSLKIYNNSKKKLLSKINSDNDYIYSNVFDNQNYPGRNALECQYTKNKYDKNISGELFK